MSVICDAPRSPAPRAAWGALFVGLLGAAVALVVASPAGWGVLAATIMAPDVALLFGWGGSGPGLLHPRAVPLYNALHHPAGPVLLGILAAAGVVGAGSGVVALAWGAHIAMDRAAGYGLRTREGAIRGG